MVDPGTHLVKNHESLSITNESQLKKTRSHKLKMLGLLQYVTRQLIWRQMPNSLLQFTEIKI